MILVADSGSSKTDWALINNDQSVDLYCSVGINPFFLTSDDVFEIVKKTFENTQIAQKVDHIYFYGAGCIKNLNTNIVLDGLHRFFVNAKIEVDDDLIGAARSIFGNQHGIACILGTGANSCKYDGTGAIEKIPTLGYILGDEASGAYFGKILINNYYKKIMPGELINKFTNKYQPEVGDVLNKVYKQASPNRYLAKFTHFLSENIEHQYCQNVLINGFRAYFENNITKYNDYQKYKIGFVGSIAYHFSEFLLKAAKDFNLSVDRIIEKPIDGLVHFHKLNK